MIGHGATTAAITVDALQNFCELALTRLAVTSADARTTADVLVTTDSWGVFTHGTKLLTGYACRLRAGGLRTNLPPKVENEGAAWAIVDGQSTLGQVTSTYAMQCAIDKARTCGTAYVGVRNSCHFGAAGYYAWLAARENMIGIAMANDVPSVAAPGSRTSVIGSNPIAFAIPSGHHDPLLLDISIATVAGSKVYACVKRGEPIPDGWLIDSHGNPTRDGSHYPYQASLAPMSGHKGYGIGLLIEALSGVLTGAAVTRQIHSWLFDDPAQPTNHGAAFIAINIASMMPLELFEQRMTALVDEIHDAATADGCDGVLVPGEREWKHRRSALSDGMRLPMDVMVALRELATDLGLDPTMFSD